MVSVVSSVREVPQIHQCVLQDPLVQETLDAMNAIPAEQRIKWTTAKLYRETIEFGVIYHQLEEDKRVVVPMLESVAKVRRVLHERFRDKIAEGSRPEDFDNCIVSIYKAGIIASSDLKSHDQLSLLFFHCVRHRIFYLSV